VLTVVVCTSCRTFVRPGDAHFVKKPVARADGDQVRLEFAVSAFTDVEVAILDAQGKVVRHLAAGVLGKNAPPPLQKDSMAQVFYSQRKLYP